MSESWTLLSRDDEEVMVLRRKNPGNRVTIWTLRPHGDSWRVVAIRFSKKNAGCNHTPERTKTYLGAACTDSKCCWDNSKHKRGIRLTDSYTDRVLLDYCEGRRV